MQVLFRVIRQDQQNPPKLQTYALEVDPSSTILDCLNQIKWQQDGTLAFRKNCRNTICGSCAMRINGRSALACKESVNSELMRLKPIADTALSSTNSTEVALEAIPEMTIAPMGNMPVIKDLVVDMQSFWANLKAVDPYVSTAGRQIPEREFLQTPEERARLNQTGNCIMCGACYSECNAREVDSSFVGPHALAKAYRMVADSRDQQTEARLEKYNQGTQGVWGCTRCYYCNAVCPMGVAPMDQIGKIKSEILDRKDAQASRSIRHRKQLIELVKQGGWIDERQFGLQVVGNSFRDLRGLFSLAPLGLKMISKGKFPLKFERSEGTDTVRSLIESAQRLESSPDFVDDVSTETPEPVGG
ncbi:succinate dehydrogenase/fumarate reductase iron-sulfur subunit [Kovacikia minuta CCNUW1]|uniref:succinate dehydrogenase/fumarate reductase iron-sulfur subunit n=1 Tax=Kovacikia minuta TaxID=2931930 RepID=UPI001CC97378|nr:succinate dehydrogenase/fumarate reductase iron-sulfur subunit [Kovacikia minuta]UBF29139.1 succinate dehydrogenase/fumarate reductase iron-sulfur subunit [Kovacikia minuta CCNUW1]